MAITYSCDRCGFKTTESGVVTRYAIEIKSDQPVQSCAVDLCDKCLETAWKGIRDQLFRVEKQTS